MDGTTPAAAIRVTCPCGAQLRIRPEQVGKRVKCPACGTTTAAEPAPAPARAQRRTGLEGLSPDYRIRPRHWLEVAWPHCRAVLGPAVGYSFVSLPIFVVLMLLFWGSLGFLLSIKPSARADTEIPLGLVLLAVGLAANVIVLPALTIGFHLVCQAQLKGQRWRFATFFSGFRWTWPLAGRAALLLAAEVVLLLPGVAVLVVRGLVWRETPPAVAGVTAGLLLANFLLSGYVVLRLVFFSHLLIIDRGCGPIQALRGSWLLSRGHFWGLCGLLMLVSLLPLLGLGVLLALPVVILALNAGYLLVASSEPLPGRQHGTDQVIPRRRALGTWLPAAAVAVAVLVFGVWVGGRAHAAEVRRDEQEARKRRQEEASRKSAAAAERFRKARASEEAEELVAFFREGGCWSTELFLPEPTEPKGGAPSGPGLPGPPGMGGVGKEPPRRILVLGPHGLRQAKPTAPGPGWTEVMRRLEELRAEERRLFYRRFADALDKGDVEAVLVEMPRELPKGSAGAGGLGRGAPPTLGTPGTGSSGGPARGARGTPVPLDKAVPLTRERFLALVERRSDQP